MRKSFEILNIKCEGCAMTLKKSLKDEFGEVKVDLEKMPRVISLDIEPNEETRLRKKLKSLGYPFADENVGVFESGGLKAKSFISCVVGKIENIKES